MNTINKLDERTEKFFKRIGIEKIPKSKEEFETAFQKAENIMNSSLSIEELNYLTKEAIIIHTLLLLRSMKGLYEEI